MLTLYASLTKLFRKCERKANIAVKKAADKARVNAAEAMKRLHATADTMRQEASELEGRAKDNFHDEMNRISSVVEGI
jgi:dsDNA-specific endonuclease/ATPase MutS2